MIIPALAQAPGLLTKTSLGSGGRKRPPLFGWRPVGVHPAGMAISAEVPGRPAARAGRGSGTPASSLHGKNCSAKVRVALGLPTP